MPLPPQCIDCGKEFNPEIDFKYSTVVCRRCAESYCEPTTADEFNIGVNDENSKTDKAKSET